MEEMAGKLVQSRLVLPRLGQLLLGCASLWNRQGEFLLLDCVKLKVNFFPEIVFLGFFFRSRIYISRFLLLLTLYTYI